MLITTTDGIIRLCMALVLGGLIGYERQAQSMAAGLRTHTLVCVGACLCMLVSINMAVDYRMLYDVGSSDPERIAAQVISGVGFLGAGAIMANQRERIVRGLTTAASIWAVAAIGLVVGAGYLALATAGTVIMFVVLTVFIRVDRLLNRHYRKTYILRVSMKNTISQMKRLHAFLSDHDLHIQSFQTISPEEEPPYIILDVMVTSAWYIKQHDILLELMAMKGVRTAVLQSVGEQEKKDYHP